MQILILNSKIKIPIFQYCQEKYTFTSIARVLLVQIQHLRARMKGVNARKVSSCKKRPAVPVVPIRQVTYFLYRA
jgi:hypothetical protein